MCCWPAFVYSGALHASMALQLACVQLRHQQLYSWKRYYRTNSICFRCGAHKTNPALHFSDLSPTAAWRATEISGEEALREHLMAPGGAPPLCTAPGWHHSLVHFDLMHNLFVSGMGNDIAGCTLACLAREGFFAGATLRTRLREAHVSLRQWKQQHNVTHSCEVFTPGRLALPEDDSTREHPEPEPWLIRTACESTLAFVCVAFWHVRCASL